jgi:hypothetical protein
VRVISFSVLNNARFFLYGILFFLIVNVDDVCGYVIDDGGLCGRCRFAPLGALMLLHVQFAGHTSTVFAFERQQIPRILFGVIRSNALRVLFGILLVVRVYATSPRNRPWHPLVQHIKIHIFELHDVKKLTVNQFHSRVSNSFKNVHFCATRLDDVPAVFAII